MAAREATRRPRPSRRSPMTQDQLAKAEQFRKLHINPGTFLAPNAWNAGSARMLEAAGFPALSTTSGGIDVPVNADLENGYGPKPEDVADTIRQAVTAGAVGGNIEDYSADPRAP